MYNKCRHILTVLLVLLSALPVLIVILFYGSQQYTRHAIKEKLENDKLTVLTMPAEHFKWYKTGKEITFNGHLFDVKTVEKLNSTDLKVIGIFDWQEDQLHKELANLMQNNDKSSNKKQHIFIKWITSLYHDDLHGIVFTSFVSRQILNLSENSPLIPKRVIDIELPPPQVTV